MQVHRRTSALVAAVLALSALAASGAASQAATSAPDTWSPLQETGGSALAVALGDDATALVSVGGPDDATVYDERRTSSGTVRARTEVMSVEGAESCRPVEAATAMGNFAVAVECLTQTGLEDPPTTLVELVWTGDDGWVWTVQRDSDLASLDYSPQGQYVVFASNSEYGRPHHVTSYHADLGWRDLSRRERGPGRDDLVAAIGDGGDIVALRGGGSEDEPGSWYGGRLSLETYDSTTGTWTQRLSRDYADGGIDPSGIDVAGGRIMAAVIESRSTGELKGAEDRVVLLSGTPKQPRSWSSPRWSRHVLTAHAAITRRGVGAAAWQEVAGRRTVTPWFATWGPRRGAQPAAYDLGWHTTPTDAAVSGRALDLSISATGHGAIAYVRHRPGASRWSVAAASFRLDRKGGLHGQVDVTWRQSADTTVDVTASATSTSVTLGRTLGPFLTSPLTRYSIGP